jgi:glyoxylase-like metal-dependent hydrolase (beta-lactamase superfamily II)
MWLRMNCLLVIMSVQSSHYPGPTGPKHFAGYHVRAMASVVQQLTPHVFRVSDTCNVYVLTDPGRRSGVAVDFGSGLVLDHLDELGIERLSHVLMTHHHRDQAQGLPRAVQAGIQIWVPPVERDLFDRVDEMWASRPIMNDYNLRQDRFSLLDPVPVTGVVPEYRELELGGHRLLVLPTPGHTPGSVSYLVRDGPELVAFTGDLIYAPGKVWSLAATQWTYTGDEGPAMTVLSCLLLRRQRPALLAPSHGEPITEAEAALGLLAERMQAYVDSRRPQPWDLAARLLHPYVKITPHLLLNRSSIANSYALLSDSGAALLFDYGYDMTTGLPSGQDRSARRPWLASLDALKGGFGVTAVEAALPTHYHDDHVAGLGLLRSVEGTTIWIPENVAPILADPLQHDLPCRWYDPIRADRVLRLGETVSWREYEITVHDLPGHTRWAVAYEVEVDGVRVLVTGDQQDGLGVPGGRRREVLNYQYRNGFRIEDYRGSATLYRRVAPGLMVSGHWEPRWVDDAYLDLLAEEGEELIDLHHALLPLDALDLGADSQLARLTPYQQAVPAGGWSELTAEVRNPHPEPAEVTARLVAPRGWLVEPAVRTCRLARGETASLTFAVRAASRPARRARCALDLTIGTLQLGQHAEALVDVVAGTAARVP